MNNTEDYTKNRAECWKEYCNKCHHSEQDLIVKGAFTKPSTVLINSAWLIPTGLIRMQC